MKVLMIQNTHENLVKQLLKTQKHGRAIGGTRRGQGCSWDKDVLGLFLLKFLRELQRQLMVSSDSLWISHIIITHG